MTQALTHWLEAHGLSPQSTIIYNPDHKELIAQTQKNSEGTITDQGALAVNTTPFTGRSPDDKYIVDYQSNQKLWWKGVNQKITPKTFTLLKKKITNYLNNQNLYVIDCKIGADQDYQQSIRVVTEFAWQALFVKNLFIDQVNKHEKTPDVTILAAPGLSDISDIGLRSSNVAIAINLEQKCILIAGSKYAGEIKKSAFTIMNAHLPEAGVLPMHCSANVGEKGDVALYFGLSGTGKTTLSSTPERKLIGDDEHGWGDNGIFNFEGGCYAKVIHLNPELEPVIWKAVNQPGTVLENVVIDPVSRRANFDDARHTENTRAAYPLSKVDNIVQRGMAGHPSNIFLLTADAFGVMPPIAKLNHDQAIYYFLSGYTSKIAGTERGLGHKPKATFSTFFAKPFLPLIPEIYAKLIEQKMAQHTCHIWLVNTGWTGGDTSRGNRMQLPYTRRMINWVLSGEYFDTSYHTDLIFKLNVPDKIKGIPTKLLYPEQTWPDHESFLATAQGLLEAFSKNNKLYSNLTKNSEIERQGQY